MKKTLFLLSIVLFYSGYFLSIFPSRTYAQKTNVKITPQPTKIQSPDEIPPTGVNLTLSPTFINLSTNPGEKVASQFTVTNNSNFREYLEIEVKKFVASDTGTGPLIQDVQATDAYVDWVTFSDNQFIVDSNQTKTIRFTVSPSSDAALGYYYAFVVNRMKSVSGNDSAAVVGSPALPVLLSVKSPNAKREIQIVDFKTDKLFYEELPVTFNITVRNTGNIHVAPAGDIFIDSMVNDEVGIVSANKGRGNILPNSNRTYTADWADGFIARVPKMENDKVVTDDKGQTTYTVKYDFTKADKFRIGKYTANLILVYDDGERDVPVEAQVSFWIIPWKLLGIGLLILILVLFGVRNIIISSINSAKKLRGK